MADWSWTSRVGARWAFAVPVVLVGLVLAIGLTGREANSPPLSQEWVAEQYTGSGASGAASPAGEGDVASQIRGSRGIVVQYSDWRGPARVGLRLKGLPEEVLDDPWLAVHLLVAPDTPEDKRSLLSSTVKHIHRMSQGAYLQEEHVRFLADQYPALRGDARWLVGELLTGLQDPALGDLYVGIACSTSEPHSSRIDALQALRSVDLDPEQARTLWEGFRRDPHPVQWAWAPALARHPPPTGLSLELGHAEPEPFHQLAVVGALDPRNPEQRSELLEIAVGDRTDMANAALERLSAAWEDPDVFDFVTGQLLALPDAGSRMRLVGKLAESATEVPGDAQGLEERGRVEVAREPQVRRLLEWLRGRREEIFAVAPDPDSPPDVTDLELREMKRSVDEAILSLDGWLRRQVRRP